MQQPFLPVVTEVQHTKTLVGFRRPPQLDEVPFPLVRVLRCPNPRPKNPGDTLELESVRVLGIRLDSTAGSRADTWHDNGSAMPRIPGPSGLW